MNFSKPPFNMNQKKVSLYDIEGENQGKRERDDEFLTTSLDLKKIKLPETVGTQTSGTKYSFLTPMLVKLNKEKETKILNAPKKVKSDFSSRALDFNSICQEHPGYTSTNNFYINSWFPELNTIEAHKKETREIYKIESNITSRYAANFREQRK